MSGFGDSRAQVAGLPLVPVVLPGGGVIQVQVIRPVGDEIQSTGLTERLNLSEALDSVSEVAALLWEKVAAAGPTKVAVEFGVGFEVTAGKLTSLIVDGKGNCTLRITLQWERNPAVLPPDA